MKKIIIPLFLFIILHLYNPTACLGQFQVKIGNDTTFCAGNISQGIQLASNLTVTGGTAPYKYCWSISNPYEYLPGRLLYASNMLNDTTLANPEFIDQYINDPQTWTQFILTVEDNHGNIITDSINVRFSEYFASTAEERIITIDKGDSIFFDFSDEYFGGILPYASYEWIPNEGLSDPYSPKTWVMPEKNTRYSFIVTDSVGCIESVISFVVIIKEPASIESDLKNNTIYQNNGIIFFDNPLNKIVTLSFYDLSGNLVHEGITTSNRYKPVFCGKGVVFLCRLTINNEQETIKYILK